MDGKISRFAPDFLPSLPEIGGVRLASASSGLVYRGRKDVFVAVFDDAVPVAGLLTQSLCPSHPVEWCRKRLDGNNPRIRALLVMAGNANAANGEAGRKALEHCIEHLAADLSCAPEQILAAQTGVIGAPMEAASVIKTYPDLVGQLSPKGWYGAAQAMMTTDTFPKLAVANARINGREVNICALAKGSGMIAPDMATMLAFFFTDAALDASTIDRLLRRAYRKSFHCLTVDGDSSTSDTILMAATSTVPVGPVSDAALTDFTAALERVAVSLAKQIAQDGEGISKFITIRVRGAEDFASARLVGMSIANSPLVKTALGAGDPNWGRLIMAIGKAKQPLDRRKLALSLGDCRVFEQGALARGYSEDAARRHLAGDKVIISVDLGVGEGQAEIFTCDLTAEYIRINADYRS